MNKLSNKDAFELAKRKFGSDRKFRFEGARGLVESGGRFVTVPSAKKPGKTLRDYEKGAILGKLGIDLAPPGDRQGIFDVKILKDHGTWVVQLLKRGRVVAHTAAVYVEEFPGGGGEKNPEVFISASSPVFWGYFAFGLAIVLVWVMLEYCNDVPAE